MAGPGKADVEIFILALQARILLWVGAGWLVVGLWLDHDPLSVAWRACLGALVAMVLAGMILRAAARSIAGRLAAEAIEQASTPAGR